MKILNFGSCNVDFVYSLNHIVHAGETETSDSMNIFPGGKGLNQSVAMACAGADVYHAGCIGADGEILSGLLKENGVDISYLKTVNERNGHAIIQVSEDGENCIFLYPGANNMITEEYIDSVLDNFEKGDIIVLQNEINMVDVIIKKAAEKQMCIVLNPSPCNKAIALFDLSCISYLLLNEIEAETLSGCKDAEKSLEFFKKNYPNMKVVLTLGKNGCIYQDKSNKIHQSAFCVKTVDTTAASDTFTGYFTAKIAEGIPCFEALKIASAASAISVSRNGAAPSIPKIDEVLVAMESMTEYVK